MIGIIITGHGEYSLGMKQAAEMIAGKQEKFTAVPFLPTDNLEDYQDKLANSINELKESSDGVLILTDLLGGTPFKTSVTLTVTDREVKVLAGTNLNMLIEGLMLRAFETDMNRLAQQLIETGKSGISLFEMIEENDEPEDGEGI